jgi:S-adenosylmethionine hydrolase
MKIITLTTDFGTGDDEANVLKGVIWSIAPETHIADLSHEIAPQDVLQGALMLERCSPYFPEGTIHVAVVDPGVGTDRRGLAARFGPLAFVGPDNGLLTLLLRRAEENRWPVEITSLENPQYWLPVVTSVFHGRDVFAPVAAHMANGVPLSEFGSPVNNPIRLEIPEPQRSGLGWKAQVIAADHFGNLSTRIRPGHLDGMGTVAVRLGGVEIRGLVKTFGERPPGELVALFNSSDFLDVSVVNGNAAQKLGVKPGDPIEVYPLSST